MDRGQRSCTTRGGWTRVHHHHCQPSLFHCWTKASLLLDHKSLSSAIPAQLLPRCFTKSVVQRVFGLPLFPLPMGFHFIRSNAQLSLALAAWPVQFHFDVFSICKSSGKFVFCFIVVLLILSSHVIPNIFRSMLS